MGHHSVHTAPPRKPASVSPIAPKLAPDAVAAFLSATADDAGSASAASKHAPRAAPEAPVHRLGFGHHMRQCLVEFSGGVRRRLGELSREAVQVPLESLEWRACRGIQAVKMRTYAALDGVVARLRQKTKQDTTLQCEIDRFDYEGPVSPMQEATS